jgi:hypothetical protein
MLRSMCSNIADWRLKHKLNIWRQKIEGVGSTAVSHVSIEIDKLELSCAKLLGADKLLLANKKYDILSQEMGLKNLHRKVVTGTDIGSQNLHTYQLLKDCLI